MVKAMLREKEDGLKRKALLLRIMVVTLVVVMMGKEGARSLWRRLAELWTGALGWSFLLSVKAS